MSSLLSKQINRYLNRLDTLVRGYKKADVERLLEDTVFPKDSDLSSGRRAGLESAKSSLMSSHLIPNNPEIPFRVSQPKPDQFYAYSAEIVLTTTRNHPVVTDSNLLFPVTINILCQINRRLREVAWRNPLLKQNI